MSITLLTLLFFVELHTAPVLDMHKVSLANLFVQVVYSHRLSTIGARVHNNGGGDEKIWLRTLGCVQVTNVVF